MLDVVSTGNLLAGLVDIDLYEEANLTDVEVVNEHVGVGGRWKPLNCRSWQKVAILVPYRSRWQHLVLLLKRLHLLLQKQKITYQIFVIEQVIFVATITSTEANSSYDIFVFKFSYLKHQCLPKKYCIIVYWLPNTLVFYCVMFMFQF